MGLLRTTAKMVTDTEPTNTRANVSISSATYFWYFGIGLIWRHLKKRLVVLILPYTTGSTSTLKASL